MRVSARSPTKDRVKECLAVARWLREGCPLGDGVTKSAQAAMTAVWRTNLDAYYFTKYDPHWQRASAILRDAYLRTRTPPQPAEPCLDESDLAASELREGVTRLTSKVVQEYENVLFGVSLRYAFHPEDVRAHIERQHPLSWRRTAVEAGGGDGEPPHVVVKLYDMADVLPQLRHIADAVQEPKEVWAHTFEAIPGGLPRAESALRRTRGLGWETVNRTLCIHYMSEEGGGPLNTNDALTEWEDAFNDPITSSNYKKQLTDVLKRREQRISGCRKDTALMHRWRPCRHPLPKPSGWSANSTPAPRNNNLAPTILVSVIRCDCDPCALHTIPRSFLRESKGKGRAVEQKQKLVKLAECEASLGVSRWTLWSWIRTGRMKAVRLPSGQFRVPEAELQRIHEAVEPVQAKQPGRIRQ